LPALELPSKNYSLEADIATGWQPKMRVVGPIPLNFDSSVVDEVVETLTMLGYRGKERVIYLGKCRFMQDGDTRVVSSSTRKSSENTFININHLSIRIFPTSPHIFVSSTTTSNPNTPVSLKE
jgi:hypothetical protein